MVPYCARRWYVSCARWGCILDKNLSPQFGSAGGYNELLPMAKMAKSAE